MICNLNHIPGERTLFEELEEISDSVQLAVSRDKNFNLHRLKELTEERRIMRGYSLPRGQHENWE